MHRWLKAGLLLVMLSFLSCTEIRELVQLGPETLGGSSYFISRSDQTASLSRITLTWPAYTQSDFLAYQVHFSSDITSVSSSDPIFITTDSDSVSLVKTGLMANTDYWVQIQILRKNNAALESNILSIKTQAATLESLTPTRLFIHDNQAIILADETAASESGLLVMSTDGSQTISQYLPLNTKVFSAAKRDNLLVMSGFDDFVAVDLSEVDPLTPTPSFSQSDILFDFVISSSNIWGALRTRGFGVYQHQDLTEFSKIGSYTTAGSFTAITSTANMAFLANPFFGVQVFTLDTPETPTLMTSIDTQAVVQALTIHNNLLMVGTNETLIIYDITTPSSPTLTSRFSLDDRSANRVKVKDDTAYISLENVGVLVIDISDPETPTHVKTIPSRPVDFEVNSATIFILDKVDGLVSQTL